MGKTQWLGSDRMSTVKGPQRFSVVYKKYWEGVFMTHFQCDLALCSNNKSTAKAYGLPVVSLAYGKLARIKDLIYGHIMMTTKFGLKIIMYTGIYACRVEIVFCDCQHGMILKPK